MHTKHYGNENLTNEELARLSQGGDDSAMTALLYRFKDKVKAITRPFFLVGADNEDLIQEGMIGLYKAIGNYSPERAASFSTYAFICIRGQIQDAIKSANRKKHKYLNEYISLYSSVCGENDDSGEFIEILKSSELNPEQKVLQEEKSKAFYQMLTKSFSGQELEVLKFFLKGASYESIAKSVGITTKKVDNTLAKIRRELNKMLV